MRLPLAQPVTSPSTPLSPAKTNHLLLLEHTQLSPTSGLLHSPPLPRTPFCWYSSFSELFRSFPNHIMYLYPMLEPGLGALQDPLVKFLEILRVSGCHFGNLKSPTVGIPIPPKLANATNRGSFFFSPPRELDGQGSLPHHWHNDFITT